MSKKFLLVIGAFFLCTELGATPVAEDLIDRYSANTGVTASRDKGKALWMKSQGERSCTTCHGLEITQPGKHIRTKKIIDPMAPSVNKDRLTDERTIEKWFKRNCKWTFKRECTLTEKADILHWLNSQ